MDSTKAIPVGISPRHVHPSKEHFLALFGEGSFLEKRGDLTQGGQFAAEQTVTLATSRGRIEPARILGPFRSATQVELSISDAVVLGLEPPVRDSGDHEGTPGITIIGPRGVVELERGVIIAQRHIHMTPADARHFGVQDKDIVWMAVNSGSRSGIRSAGRRAIFGDVIVRVDASFRLDFHLDTDEANSARVKTGDSGQLIKEGFTGEEEQDDYYPRKRLYSEWDVRRAYKEGKKIIIEKGTKLTPSARDYGKNWGVLREG